MANNYYEEKVVPQVPINEDQGPSAREIMFKGQGYGIGWETNKLGS